MRINKYICPMLLAASLVAAACSDKDDILESAPVPSGNGNTLTLTIDTRSVTPGDGNQLDGGGMNDLRVILVPGNNLTQLSRQVAAVEYIKAPIDGTDDKTGVTERQLVFNNLQIGFYTVYAYANTTTSDVIENLLKNVQNSDGTVTETGVSQLKAGDYWDHTIHRNLVFNTLTGDATPNVASGNMLITGYTTIAVGVGNNSATVEMKRPVVDFELQLVNHSDYCVRVDASTINFSDFNASTSYVLPFEDSYPNGLKYRAMPTGTEIVYVEPSETGQLYRRYIYENAAPEYKFGFKLDFVRRDEYTNAYADEALASATLADAANGVYLQCTVGGATYYLTDDGGTPVLSPFVTGDAAKWTITAATGGYILQNASTGRYMHMLNTDQQLAPEKRPATRADAGSLDVINAVTLVGEQASATVVQLSATDNAAASTAIYITDGTANAYLSPNADGTLPTVASTAVNWSLFTLKDGATAGSQKEDIVIKSATASDIQMKVIDPVTAHVSNMTQMRRNEHVTVTVNVYYNEQSGEFYYVCDEWEYVTPDNIEFE